MARSNLPDDDANAPDPAGVKAGPQGGTSGVGGERRGASLAAEAEAQNAHAPGQRKPPVPHQPGSDEPGYRARPAGQSGVGAQADHVSTLREPQGDGNYQATDQGPRPLRDGG